MKTFNNIKEGFFQNSGSGYETIKTTIEDFFTEFGIPKHKYSINDDLTVDVNSSIILNADSTVKNKFSKIKKLPFSMNKIKGYLYISDFLELETLEGLPQIVENNLYLRNLPKLTSLKHIPSKVQGSIHLFFLDNISSIDYFPLVLGESISINYLTKLKTLRGLPKKCNGDFMCNACKSLTSFNGLPEIIMGVCDLEKNRNISKCDIGNIKHIEGKLYLYGSLAKVDKDKLINAFVDSDCIPIDDIIVTYVDRKQYKKLSENLVEGFFQNSGSGYDKLQTDTIHSFMSECGVSKEIYKIRDDLSVDCLYTLIIDGKKLKEYKNITELPITINSVDGDLSIYELPKLKSLKGLPKKISGKLYLGHLNSLISLKYCTEICQSVNFNFMENLKSLKHFPQKIQFNIELMYLDSIPNLEGLPKNVYGDFVFKHASDLTLKGIPEYIEGACELSDVEPTTLEDIKIKKIDGNVYLENSGYNVKYKREDFIDIFKNAATRSVFGDFVAKRRYKYLRYPL